MDKTVFTNTVLALLKISPGLGGVQINKALIMIDALYHSYYKKTLTGITYIKHWFGPVPDFEAKDELYRMEFGKIKVVKERSGNFVKHAHYAIEEPDYAVLPNKAIEIIQDVVSYVKGNIAGKLSEITHDAVYENAHMGDVIPIESIYSFQSNTSPWTEQEKEDTNRMLQGISESDEFDLSSFYS